MGPIELVIFDCDGVLIDSERLAVRTEATILAELGWPLSEPEIVERFVGRSPAYMQACVEAEIGRPIDWDREFDRRHRAAFCRELTAVEGVVEALDAIDLPICVASSSTPEMLAYTLGLTGLAGRFAGRVFSASEVPSGKPEPDLFLHAARSLGVTPARCAVVEDSRSGVDAGVAAGMQVFAFAGGVTPPKLLELDGVVVFDAMTMLPGLLLD